MPKSGKLRKSRRGQKRFSATDEFASGAGWKTATGACPPRGPPQRGRRVHSKSPSLPCGALTAPHSAGLRSGLQVRSHTGPALPGVAGGPSRPPRPPPQPPVSGPESEGPCGPGTGSSGGADPRATFPAWPGSLVLASPRPRAQPARGASARSPHTPPLSPPSPSFLSLAQGVESSRRPRVREAALSIIPISAASTRFPWASSRVTVPPSRLLLKPVSLKLWGPTDERKEGEKERKGKKKEEGN